MILALVLSATSFGESSKKSLAGRVFERIAGYPLAYEDTRWTNIEQLATQGRLSDIAKIAVDDQGFYNITMRNFSAPLLNFESDQTEFLNDAQAMVIGTVRDDRSFKEILTGNYRYDVTGIAGGGDGTSNAHFSSAEIGQVNLKDRLVRVNVQASRPDSAGVLTSRGWGEKIFTAGTNRRAVSRSFENFLCLPIASLANNTVPRDHIRRDVTRAPGGDPTIFDKKCSSCHAGMDAIAGAFSYFDFAQGSIRYRETGLKVDNLDVFDLTSGVAVKTIRYPGIPLAVPPPGNIPSNDSWANVWAQSNVNLQAGWRNGSVSGSGVQSVGAMLAETRAFSTCMAKRVFTVVCKRSPFDEETADIDTMANRFEASGYNLKEMFYSAVSLGNCVRN